VLKFALALEIEGVEKHLGHRLRVLLGGDPLRQPARDSLIRQKFLQVDSNKETALGREAERCSRDRDAGRVFSRSWFLFGPSPAAATAKGPGHTLARIWTG